MPVRDVPVRPPSFRSALSSGRDDCSAGVSPKRMPTAIVAREREQRDPPVEDHVVEARQIPRREAEPAARSVQCATSSPSRAAGHRQHHAFGEQLLHQPAASGAERRAHRELAATRRRHARSAARRHWRTRSATRSRPRRSAPASRCGRSATMLAASGSPSSDAAGITRDVARQSDRRSTSAAPRASITSRFAGDAPDRAEVMHVADSLPLSPSPNGEVGTSNGDSIQTSLFSGWRTYSGTTPMISVGAPLSRTCVPITAGIGAELLLPDRSRRSPPPPRPACRWLRDRCVRAAVARRRRRRTRRWSASR